MLNLTYEIYPWDEDNQRLVSYKVTGKVTGNPDLAIRHNVVAAGESGSRAGRVTWAGKGKDRYGAWHVIAWVGSQVTAYVYDQDTNVTVSNVVGFDVA